MSTISTKNEDDLKIPTSQLSVECYYCGIICDGTGTRDHVKPYAQFLEVKYLKFKKGHVRGKNVAKRTLRGNTVFACPRCNGAKADMTQEEFYQTNYYKKECLSNKWRGIHLRPGR